MKRLCGARPLVAVPRSRAGLPDAGAADGELAAAIFGGLESGKSAVQLVVELKVHPDVIEAFERQWARMRLTFLMTPRMLQAIARMPCWDGDDPIEGGDAFLAGLKNALAAAGMCEDCRGRRAQCCSQCRRVAVTRALEKLGRRHREDSSSGGGARGGEAERME